MKSKHLILILTFCLSVNSFSQINDNSDGTSMVPIMNVANPIIETVETEGLEIVRMEFDIIKTTKESYRTLHADLDYAILAFGDYRISDIDIKVYKDVDGNWFEITKDEDSESQALVTVSPSATGLYKFEIKAYEFIEGYSAAHYGLLICH